VLFDHPPCKFAALTLRVAEDVSRPWRHHWPDLRNRNVKLDPLPPECVAYMIYGCERERDRRILDETVDISLFETLVRSPRVTDLMAATGTLDKYRGIPSGRLLLFRSP